MKIRSLVLSAAAALAFGAQAAPVSSPIGNVTILGNSYAVSVLYDSEGSGPATSFNALAPSITFTTQADGLAAATALFNTFGATGPAGVWNPGITAFSGVRVVWRGDASSYDFYTVSQYSPDGPDGPFINVGSSGPNSWSFAQFSSVSSVPEPQALALALVGLAFVAGRVVTKRRKAN